MQTLSTLLRKLASISMLLNAMQNRAVAYYLASKMKVAANMLSTDYVDIADIVESYVSEATPGDFCQEDIDRLCTLGKLLQDANNALHNVQNTIPAAE